MPVAGLVVVLLAASIGGGVYAGKAVVHGFKKAAHGAKRAGLAIHHTIHRK